MKKQIEYLLKAFLFLAIFYPGCNNPNKEAASTFSVLGGNKKSNLPSDLLLPVDSVSLKVPDDVFLTGTDVLLINPDRYIVLSSTALKALVFDKKGNYIRSIGGRGRGPGEFLSIRCGAVKSDSLYIYDMQQKIIQIFNINNSHSRSIKYNGSNIPNGISIDNNDNIILRHAPTNVNNNIYSVLSKSGKVLKSFCSGNEDFMGSYSRGVLDGNIIYSDGYNFVELNTFDKNLKIFNNKYMKVEEHQIFNRLREPIKDYRDIKNTQDHLSSMAILQNTLLTGNSKVLMLLLIESNAGVNTTTAKVCDIKGRLIGEAINDIEYFRIKSFYNNNLYTWRVCYEAEIKHLYKLGKGIPPNIIIYKYNEKYIPKDL